MEGCKRLTPDPNAPGKVTRVVHLIRHAEGRHNEAAQRCGRSEYLKWDYFDAMLTPKGLSQCHNMHSELNRSGWLERISIVVTSPLTRTIQTALRILSGASETDELTNVPINFKIIAMEECRERHGVYPCDKRKSREDLKSLFPQVDFTNIKSCDDQIWNESVREQDEGVQKRVGALLEWVACLPPQHREIAIFSHSSFISQAFNVFHQKWPKQFDGQLVKFQNCEIRSVELELPYPKYGRDEIELITEENQEL